MPIRLSKLLERAPPVVERQVKKSVAGLRRPLVDALRAECRLAMQADANGDWIPAWKADGCPYDETPEQLEELKKSFPTPRHTVDYIMDTFPIVKRKDEAAHGSYRTKETILEIYDAMQEAMRTGGEYKTTLDPPPGNPKCCHPGGRRRRIDGETCIGSRADGRQPR